LLTKGNGIIPNFVPRATFQKLRKMKPFALLVLLLALPALAAAQCYIGHRDAGKKFVTGLLGFAQHPDKNLLMK